IKIKDSKIVVLKSKLEKISNEKNALDVKIGKFVNASQSLDKLTGSQITDNSKSGLGYDYESDEEDKVESPPEKERKNVEPSVNKVEVEIPKQNESTRRPVKYAKMANKGKVVKASACWVWRPIKLDSTSIVLKKHTYGHSHKQIEDQGYFDSSCSWNMTGNISYLTDFKEFDGGYVAFGVGAKGGKITGKGTIRTADESYVLLKVPRKKNMYSVDMKNIIPKKDLTCLVAKATNDESMLWHMRLGHINFKNINKLVKDNFVRELPSKRFKNEQTCVACLKGKQHKVSFKSIIQIFITQPLLMLHIDLFGPTSMSSIMHKKYCLVITDDFSRFTWVLFLASKDETSRILRSFITEIENLVDKKVKIIRSDNGTEFKNIVMNEFYEEKVNTACYVLNMVLVVKHHFKTPYELFRGRTAVLSFMRPFGCHVTILNTLDRLGKFDGKSDEGFFVGYSTNSKAFRVYNTRTRKVEENLHINFLENKPLIPGDRPKWLFDIDTLTESMNYVPVSVSTNLNDFAGKGASFNAERPNDENSPKDINIVGPSINTATSNINTASLIVNTVRLSDDYFGANNDMRSLDGVKLDISNLSTTYPVPTTPNTRINKDHSLDNVICDMQSGDERGIVIRNKAKLIAHGCTQEEGIDYDEFFALVARIKAMRLFLAYVSFMRFLVYQIDVKSAFLFERIEEEVYVCQPPGFEDPDYPDKVYKVEKSLYGLHQAPRAWNETLSTKKKLCTKFEVLMHEKFQMSSMGELTFFLELQVKQKSDGIFISQDKYVDEILRKFKYEDVKRAGTPMDKEKALLKDLDGDDVDVHLYRKD
nr:hypothetical protein [Tanacetum cinerariifolium]